LSQKVDFNNGEIHNYTLCGLHTRSDIPLTSVPPSPRAGESADILIETVAAHSTTAKNASRMVFDHSLECSIIRIVDVADFEVSRGRHIRVWPAVGATQKDVEIFLFGPVWATLCHQRGMLPLHASAVASKTGITAFAGHPGVGKSTTAALLSSFGFNYEFVADDILPVSLDQDSMPGAWPYLRRLKLQRDPIIQLALTPTETVSERLDKVKYFVRPRCVADDKWSRLERLYLLECDSAEPRVSIERITGAQAVRALIDQTYHFQFIRCSGRFRDHLMFCTRLASTIDVYSLRRSPLVGAGKELMSFIRKHIEETTI
jgi:hypothetical protein